LAIIGFFQGRLSLTVGRGASHRLEASLDERGFGEELHEVVAAGSHVQLHVLHL
jgi:hypothetical protein